MQLDTPLFHVHDEAAVEKTQDSGRIYSRKNTIRTATTSPLTYHFQERSAGLRILRIKQESIGIPLV